MITAVILVQITAAACKIVKFMCRNTQAERLDQNITLESEKESVLLYDKNLFGWKLAVAYAMGAGVVCGSIATVIMNDLVSPPAVSFWTAEVYLYAVLFDLMIQQFAYAFVQFTMAVFVHRARCCCCLKYMLDDEVCEEIGIEEAEPTSQ